MGTHKGTQLGTARTAGRRWIHRVVAVGAVATACLVGAPGLASASPQNPSNSQLSAAAQAKADAEKQVGQISAQLATAQASVDAAHAASNIALDAFEGKQAEYETAQAAADKAAAAARQAQADLAAARGDVAAFARSSYMQGSTSPMFSALLSSDGPAQLLERQSLLESAGGHRSDVLVAVAVVQKKAAVSETTAKTALTQAATLKQQASQALAVASQKEAGARQQATAMQTQQVALQAQLKKAQQTLLGMQGARAAADRYAAQQAAAAKAAADAAARAAAESNDPVPAPAPDNPTPNNPTPSGPSDPGPGAGSGSSSAAQTAIRAAKRWIGTRYAWGGGSLTGPSEGWGIDAGVVGFDCSGLTRYAYAQAGIYIPRNSSAQYAALPKVSRSNLQPGDLVFYATNTWNPATIHHVAMYLGDGMMIEAPESGLTVRVTAMRWGEYIGAVRPSA
ncbi:MAG TPA: C40 family peptidase [Blastococcus sp.]|nr:C40 family peptidase [Blastococcus sp.]